MKLNKTYEGNCIETMMSFQDDSIDCCVTSPPYWGLRDYGCDGQIGLEETPEMYINNMVEVFAEVKRILKPEGTLWLNLGDSYMGNCSRTSSGRAGYGKPREGVYQKAGLGLKTKDLAGIPWRVAMALQQSRKVCRLGCDNPTFKYDEPAEDYYCELCGERCEYEQGWYLRQDIIWHKTNPMPESVKDRCTKSHEYIFLLSKRDRYYFDADAIKEEAVTGGVRNKRDVWTVPVKPYKEAHFATFPPDLIKPCILAGCPNNGIVLDPFMGSGTTAMVAKDNGRRYVGCELNPEYIKLNRANQ